MRRIYPLHLLGVTILVLLMFWLIGDNSPETERRLISAPTRVVPPPVASKGSSRPAETPIKKAVLPRFAPLPNAKANQESESAAAGSLDVVVPPDDAEEKPPIPDYEMPVAPDIMPFEFQRVFFKDAPDDKGVGLALYLRVNDPQKRQYAYLHRRYLAQLTSYLASHYQHEAIKTPEGKRAFVDMLKVRFKRRVKSEVFKDLDFAFFEELD